MLQGGLFSLGLSEAKNEKKKKKEKKSFYLVKNHFAHFGGLQIRRFFILFTWSAALFSKI